jgi:Cft2 family RNA processing exonuclease
MFTVEIGGMRCLYTGDYSRISDRHMPAADLPDMRPNIGVQAHQITMTLFCFEPKHSW